MYYHGVPRVFDDGDGNVDLCNFDSCSPELREFVRHTRINISIRCVS